MTPLNRKIDQSTDLIRAAAEQYGFADTAVAWSGGKDSTVLLHLIQRYYGTIPFPVINLDTGRKFPEIYAFRDHLARLWEIDLEIVANQQPPANLSGQRDPVACCHFLKTVPLNDALTRAGRRALMTAIRGDEASGRDREATFSPRTSPPHMRIHPLLFFTEADIWTYTKSYQLPYCRLYDQGYRSLGCQPCTAPAEGERPERTGRNRQKTQRMNKLRQLGYF